MKTKKIIPEIIFIFAVAIITGLIFIKNYKPSFKSNDQALSYLWKNISNDNGNKSIFASSNSVYGEKKIKIGKDSTILITADMNYDPTWNRNRIYISLETKGNRINFIAENAGKLGWFRNNNEDYPDLKKLYLSSFSKKDIELLKIAYKKFKK